LKYEDELRYIVITHGREKITDWVVTHGTFFEAVWWYNQLREAETGRRFTNAEQLAVWGPKYTSDIRTAGQRLKEKLVEAFLGTELDQK